MKVRVIYFGMLKDAVGRQSDDVTLPEGATLGDLVEDRIRHTEVIDNFRKVLAFSVNQEYAQLSNPLHDGDEIAMLPPVSGGAPRCRLVREPIAAGLIMAEVKSPEDGAVSIFGEHLRRYCAQ
jgi:MoaE-MoaD fusion protein